MKYLHEVALRYELSLRNRRNYRRWRFQQMILNGANAPNLLRKR